MTRPLQDLSVLTFNAGLLHMSAFGRTLFEPVPWVEPRAAALPHALRALDADVVCLQEIYTARHRQVLAAALADLYPHVAAPSRARILPSGLMLLSKFPILAHRFHAFRAGPGDERWFVQKGFQEVTLRLGDGSRLRLFNLHTTAGGRALDPEDSRTDRYRARQIDQILAAAAAPSDATLTLIVGDLNAGPPVSMDNYAQLTAAGWIDLYAHRRGADTTDSTWSGDHPLAYKGPHRHQQPQRIDHVFAPAEAPLAVIDAQIVLTEPVVSVRDWVGLSDHFGVKVRIAL